MLIFYLIFFNSRIANYHLACYLIYLFKLKYKFISYFENKLKIIKPIFEIKKIFKFKIIQKKNF